MKFVIVLFLAVLIGILVFKSPQAQRFMGPDPTEAMKAVAEALPLKSDVNYKYELGDVSYDVEKTDSLVNPIVGHLDFEAVDYIKVRYVFHWKDGQWVFTQMVNQDNGMDFTHTPGGVEFMQSPPMREFLNAHGYDPE